MEIAPPSPCLNCGQIPVPRVVNRVVHVTPPVGKPTPLLLENRSHPSRGPEYIPLTDLCLLCLSTLERARAWQVLDLIGDLRGRRSIWMIECMPGYEFGEEWADFSTLTFGNQIGIVRAPADSHPFDSSKVSWAAHYRPTGGLIFVTQTWLRRVRYRDTPLYLEERWNPLSREPEPVLYGLRPDVPDKVVHQALRGRRLLQVLNQYGGRPRGSGRFRDADECKVAVVRAMRKEMKAGRVPRQADIECMLYNQEQHGRQLRRDLYPYKYMDLLRQLKSKYPDAGLVLSPRRAP